MSASSSAVLATNGRLKSLDQFRGYTMLGMLLVNFLGSYAICPRTLRHTNDYCSYADTIMPQFLFAAGFAMRLSLTKRLEAGNPMPWGRVIRRIVCLALIAIVWYSFCDLTEIVALFRQQPIDVALLDLFKRRVFQTLLHIAATSLWILPVIGLSARVRFAYLLTSGLLHVGISWWFNFSWVNSSPTGIDGGPLGFLAWSVPALAGTLACDMVRLHGIGSARRLVACGVVVALCGWGMSNVTVLYNVHREKADSSSAAESIARVPKYADDPVIPKIDRWKGWNGTYAEPPFVPPPSDQVRQWNYWMMCQRCSSLSYVTFAAGISLVLYALFLFVSDGLGVQVGLFRTLGTNSLAAYLLHDIAGWLITPYVPKDSSVGLVLMGLLASIGFVYLGCCLLERKGWYLRV